MKNFNRNAVFSWPKPAEKQFMTSPYIKHILMLNYEFPPLGGGAGNANFYLLKQWKNNEQVHIDLVTSSTDAFKIEHFASNIKVHYLDIGKGGEGLLEQKSTHLLKYSYLAYKYAKGLIRLQKYDLVHAFFGIPCGYIAMKLGLPYMVSLRGSDVPFHNPKYKLADKLVFQRLSKKIWSKALHVVANSKGLLETALLTTPKLVLANIPNGIDTNIYYPNHSELKADVLELILVGRLSKIKGISYLLQALEGIARVRLTLIGDGPAIAELKAQAQQLNIDVVFAGRKNKPEVVKALQAAHVFVLPSLNEGMSNALLEAMACGLPVIATNVGGSAELVHNNGSIVEKANPMALRAAINQYVQQPELLHIHGTASVAIAKSYSWENVAQQYFDLYFKTQYQ